MIYNIRVVKEILFIGFLIQNIMKPLLLAAVNTPGNCIVLKDKQEPGADWTT